MLENKRERLRTFLRKIDEKAIFRIKHFMRESYAVDGGGLPGKDKEKNKKRLQLRKTQSLEEAQLELQQCNKTLAKQVSLRSQTFDYDRSLERTESSVRRSSFMKHNKTFHKLFKDIPENEDLVHAFLCALQREVPYHGRLYVSENHICFHSSVLLKATKVVIPVSSVHILKKQNTALLVPNALSIRTNEGEKFLFVSLRNREVCYKLLKSVCPQIDEGSSNSSPLFSSAEYSFDLCKAVNSSQSSLDDSFDLDRGEFRGLLDSRSHKPIPDPVAHRSVQVQRSHTQTEREESSSERRTEGSWVRGLTEKVQSYHIERDSRNLNTLLFFYLILVLLLLLSSGYIGLRIVALEEQLSSLGALPEFSLQGGYEDT